MCASTRRSKTCSVVMDEAVSQRVKTRPRVPGPVWCGSDLALARPWFRAAAGGHGDDFMVRRNKLQWLLLNTVLSFGYGHQTLALSARLAG